MQEHQFVVSTRGDGFLFRTEWETDQDRVNEVRRELLARFRSADGFCVGEYRRRVSLKFESLP